MKQLERGICSEGGNEEKEVPEKGLCESQFDGSWAWRGEKLERRREQDDEGGLYG